MIVTAHSRLLTLLFEGPIDWVRVVVLGLGLVALLAYCVLVLGKKEKDIRAAIVIPLVVVFLGAIAWYYLGLGI